MSIDFNSTQNLLDKIKDGYLNNKDIPIEDRFKAFDEAMAIYSKNDDVKATEVDFEYLKFILENWKHEHVINSFKKVSSSFRDALLNIKVEPHKVNEKMVAAVKDPHFRENFKTIWIPLYQKIHKKILLLDLENHTDLEVQIKKFNEILPSLHSLNLPMFSQMIFSDQLKPEDPLTEKAGILKGVYNQTGYDEGMNFSGLNWCKKGADLSLTDIKNNDIPIGYNILLPADKVKAFVVTVYGGFNNFVRKEKMYVPGGMSPLEQSLLDNGIAVIQLNLVDLLNEERQHTMSEDLHKQLHASINKFYETITSTPELLHTSLRGLKDQPGFLYGSSFGGRTSVRHAELYPHTFNGYISFDGALSFEMLKNSVLPFRSFPHFSEWIDPIKEVNKIQDPLLLLHNMDDNNVNLKVTLDFYKKGRQATKPTGNRKRQPRGK